MELQKPESLENREILPNPQRAVTPLRPFVTTGAAWINTILLLILTSWGGGEKEGAMLVKKELTSCVSKDEAADLLGQR